MTSAAETPTDLVEAQGSPAVADYLPGLADDALILPESLPLPDADVDEHTDPFIHAVQGCIGVGRCRTTSGGVMCPSFRATRDEKDSTRGRARVLQEVVRGTIGVDDPAVEESLELCLACKACSSDCPTGVDMAKMKIEFLHHYHARHGLPLKERLVAALPLYAGTAARLAPLLNLRDRLPGARAIVTESVACHDPAGQDRPFDRLSLNLRIADPAGRILVQERGLIDGAAFAAEPSLIGHARRIDGAGERYMEFVKHAFPRGLRLDGLRVVVDAAAGGALFRSRVRSLPARGGEAA